MSFWLASVLLTTATTFTASSNGERLENIFAIGPNKSLSSRRDGKSASTFEFTFDVGCQEGTRPDLGLTYTGRANMTYEGKACLVWADVDIDGYPGSWTQDEHNYCRRRGSGRWRGVWCVTSFNPVEQWDFCPVPECKQLALYIPADYEGALLSGRPPPSAHTSWPGTMMPSSWTICSAFMLNDWPSAKLSKILVWLLTAETRVFLAYLEISATEGGTTYLAKFQEVYSVRITTKKTLFPGKWIRSCFSHHKMESNETQLRLVIDGSLISEDKFVDYDYNYDRFELITGNDNWNIMFRGMATDVNMFSTALTKERMKEMTVGQGGESCGQAGDFISWPKTLNDPFWTIEDTATMLELDKDFHSPCRKMSSLNIFIMDGLHRHQDCMQHCQKLGQGRSPRANDLQQWQAMLSELEVITTKANFIRILSGFLIWLSVTEGDPGGRLARLSHWPTTEVIVDQGEVLLVANETVWRDYYTGARADVLSLRESLSGGEMLDDVEQYNCMLLEFDLWGPIWRESSCVQSHVGCLCEYARDPVVTLRGLCLPLYEERAVDSMFFPLQNRSDPSAFHWQGNRHSTLILDASDKTWRLNSTASQVRAVSNAPLLSFGLGLHMWEVSSDTWCNKNKQSYTTWLKFTGCDQSGEFTCHDGQCISMEKRCNQVPNCRDKSDEMECQLIVLKNGYNKNVPPISVRSGADDTIVPVAVNISITLMKVVEIEEVDHSIHLQFRINLQWRENRVKYQNLKEKASLNALTNADISQLWLPLVIYDNTDQKESTRLGETWEWVTRVSVVKEGNFIRSGIDEVDEAEIFEGAENTLIMTQTYTWEFQCKYKLKQYPFDTQVNIKFDFFLFRHASVSSTYPCLSGII